MAGNPSPPAALVWGHPHRRATDAPPDLIQALAARIHEDVAGQLIAWRPGGQPRASSHAEVWARATRIAAGLRRQGPCERRIVVLPLPNVLDFVAAFWACLLAGAVPLPFGGAAHSRQRLALLGERLTTLGVPFLLVEDDFDLRALADPVWQSSRPLRLSALEGFPPIDLSEPRAESGILVPTSGSTGRLQLAWLSPRALLNRYLTRRLRPEQFSRVAISPFPNDGVSGLGAAFLSYRDWVQLPPGALAAQPLTVLDAVERCRGEILFLSTSMALQIMAAARGSDRRWDLGCLRSVLVGAEPVVAGVMRELANLLAQQGSKSCRIWAGYGTTETGTLVEGADPTAWSDADRGVLGGPLPGVGLRIVGESGETLAEGDEGDIEVLCREKLFTGYWGEPERAGLTEDGWWRTGDLGCLRDGQLLVRGRKKEVFIAHGRKFALADIDVSLQQALGAGVRVLSGVLAGDAGTPEQLAIAYAPLTADAAPEGITATIQATLARGFGLRAGRIQPLDLDCLPLTVAGKPQRTELVRLLLAARPLTYTRPESVPEAEDTLAVVDAIWREILGDAAVRQPATRFVDLGGESLQSALLRDLIQERLGRTLPVEAFFAEPTLDWLRQWVSSAPSAPPGEDREVHVPEERPWPLPHALHQTLLTSLEGVIGARPTRDQLVVGLNMGGKQPPLFWCSTIVQKDLPLFAKQLGPEQPLYGFRSPRGLLRCTEETIQQFALRYLHDIGEIFPTGPLFLGGYCEGGAIMLAVAQHLLRRRRQILLLTLLECGFALQHYAGQVLLIYGRDSPQVNPLLRYRQPETGWRRYFRDYSIEEIPGDHHGHIKNIEIFAERLKLHLERAMNQPMSLVPWHSYPAILESADIPSRLSTGELRQVAIGINNRASYAWSSVASGVWLGNYWMNARDKTILKYADGRTECPELRPGETVILPLTITAPAKAGSYRLVVDLVEEGSHWLDPRRRSALVKTVEVV